MIGNRRGVAGSCLVGLFLGFSSLSVIAGNPLGGLGAKLELTDEGVILRDVIAGSPAARAGIESGDIITEVNSTPLQGLGVHEVLPLLRGPVGSPVVLMISGEGIEQPTSVEVIRQDLTKFAGVRAEDWRGPDAEALGRIQLPANPTRAQVRLYIDRIARASHDQTVFSVEDPQIAMLAKVGADNLDVLLKSPASLSYYVAEVVAGYADEGNKEMILDALSRNVELIRVVVQKGWIEDARTSLIEGLRDHRRYLPSQWIEAVASFRDPRTYDDLLAYLIAGPNRLRTYRAVQHLPGVDLAKAVDKAWQNAKTACSPSDRTSFAPAALDFGHLDALQAAVDSLQRLRNDPEWMAGDRKLILQHVDVRGTNQQIVQWFHNNKSGLSFDQARGKFRASAMQ